MRGRLVLRFADQQPDKYPDDANEARDDKRKSPPIARRQEDGERWCNHGPDRGPTNSYTVGKCPLFEAEPLVHRFGGAGKTTTFAKTEQQP